MPKQIVIEPCIINYGDDRGGLGHAAGEIVDVTKDTANTLARAGRTLYVNKAEDPDKNGLFTASKEMMRAAEAMGKPAAKTADAA